MRSESPSLLSFLLPALLTLSVPAVLVSNPWWVSRSPGEPEKPTVIVCSVLGSGYLDSGVCSSAQDPRSVLD